MNNLNVLFDELNDKPIVYHRIYTKITGSITGGLLLSQLIYWDRKMKHKKFYKTDDNFCQETGMTLEELKTAKKKVNKFVQITREGIPAKTHYKVDISAIIKAITSYGESPQLDMGNPHNLMTGIPITTTENTQRIQQIYSEKSKNFSEVLSQEKEEKEEEEEELIYEEPERETFNTKKKQFTKMGLSYKPSERTPAQKLAWDTEMLAREIKEIKGDVYINQTKSSQHWQNMKRAVKNLGRQECLELFKWYLTTEKCEKIGFDIAIVFSDHSISQFKWQKNKTIKKTPEQEVLQKRLEATREQYKIKSDKERQETINKSIALQELKRKFGFNKFKVNK